MLGRISSQKWWLGIAQGSSEFTIPGDVKGCVDVAQEHGTVVDLVIFGNDWT